MTSSVDTADREPPRVDEAMDDSPNLKRELKPRHMIMIAIGGTLGTGLFLGSGSALHSAGPGGTLTAYILISIIVLIVMMCLGELATFMPVSGSFSSYATRFIDPALGFAFGWNYWLAWALTLAAELSASALIMKFWFPDTPSVMWSAIFLAFLFFLNYMSVKGYGEGEYWFSFIKVAAVIIFSAVGFLLIFGVIGGHPQGWENFTVDDAPFVGGVMGTFGVFLTAGFSFSGTEAVGVTAGESRDPRKNVPRAIRSTFWRILLFYVVAIFVISMLIPYTTGDLTKGGVITSPFTMVFQKAGLSFAASAMNAVILMAVLSTGNSCLYVTSRIMHAMALNHQAPRFLAKVNHRGVPVRPLIATSIIGALVFLSSVYGDGVVFTWLLNSVGITTFIFWLGIALSQYRFRKAYVAQGRDPKNLPFRMRFFPYGTLFALIALFLIVIAQGYEAFLGNHIDWYSVLAVYLGVPIFLILWLGYKFINKTSVVPLKECDFG